MKLAAPADYEDLVQNWGLEFSPIKNGFRQIFEMEPGTKRMKGELNPVRLLYQRKSDMEPVVNQILSDLWAAGENTDVILYTVLALPAYYIARDYGIPAFPICFQPLSRTQSFPNVLFSSPFSNLGFVNRASYILAEQALWRLFRSFMVQWRKKSGLTPIPFWGHFKQFYDQNNPVFNGYSPQVAPKPDDWGDRMHVTGYWFLDDTLSRWSPDPRLTDFIKSGPPPVCIGFGSMNDNRVKDRVKTSIMALKKAGKRGIFLAGKSDLKPKELPLNNEIFVTAEVPHSWLFPKVSAVIHHGGAGTTAAAIRAGVPSIIVPFFFDQLFWGKRLEALEVGPGPITKQQLSVETLANAIKGTVGNKDYLKNLKRLSIQVRAENGVKNVVEAFHRELTRI